MNKTRNIGQKVINKTTEKPGRLQSMGSQKRLFVYSSYLQPSQIETDVLLQISTLVQPKTF